MGAVRNPNQLNDLKKLKLSAWLDESRDYLQQRPTFDAAAARATRELGFRVTDNNLVSLSKLKGLDWQPRRRRRCRRTANVQDTAARDAIRELYERLGEAVPGYLQSPEELGPQESEGEEQWTGDQA